jgi:hypothetical protein
MQKFAEFRPIVHLGNSQAILSRCGAVEFTAGVQLGDRRPAEHWR